MGVVVAIIAIGAMALAAQIITQKILDDLQRDVNKIVASHSDQTTKLKALQTLLEKLDFSKIYSALDKMNKDMNQNFKQFLLNQKEKVQLLKTIDIDQTEQKSSFWTDFMSTINTFATTFSLIQLGLATNPATEGVAVVIGSILNVLGAISNIQNIEELKKQKDQLINYFKAGGQFEQQQQKILGCAVSMTQNLYLMVTNGKNMLKMLGARIALFQVQTSTSINYNTYFAALREDPFSSSFQESLFNSYSTILTISQDKQLNLSSQISRSYTILSDLVDGHDVPAKIQKLASILEQFSADSPIGKQLELQAKIITLLSDFRAFHAKNFANRQKQTHEEQIIGDPMILNHMYSQMTSNFPSNIAEIDKERYIAEVVSFFTTSFYGDNQTGETLYNKFNLKQFQKKTHMLNYASPFSNAQNFILPKPEGEGLVDWQSKKQALEKSFMQTFNPQVPGKPTFENMYMRTELKYAFIGNKSIEQIQLFYGISMSYHAKYYSKEMTIEELSSALVHPSVREKRMLAFMKSSSLIKFVVSPVVFEGIKHINNDNIPLALKAMHLFKKGGKLEKIVLANFPRWRNYRVNGQKIFDFADSFKGLCINFKDIKVSETQIITTNAKCLIVKEEIIMVNQIAMLPYQVKMYVTGFLSPKKLESIDISSENHIDYTVKVSWSPNQEYSNMEGKVLSCIQSTIQYIKQITDHLRSKGKELFMMTITQLWRVFYWYLE